MELPPQRQVWGRIKEGVQCPQQASHVRGGSRGEEKDAVGISSREGSGSLEVSDLTPGPTAGDFNLFASCEELCNHRDRL